MKVIKHQMHLFKNDWRTIAKHDGNDLKTIEGIKAWKKAYRKLQYQKQLSPFKWSNALAAAARDHCRDIGTKGLSSHKGSDGSHLQDRMKRYGTWKNLVAENIAFGLRTGSEYIFSLYVDDGVSSRKNRMNIVNPHLNLVGMDYCKHKKYGGSLVIVYASEQSHNSLLDKTIIMPDGQ